MEKRENILGKDPLQEKFKIKSIKENLLSSRFPIWKLLEEILSQSILRGCFSYNISLYVRFWLHEISIWEKRCGEIFLETDRASKLFCKEPFCQQGSL